MKTILHVIDTTGPGGAETVFVELASSLREYGYRNLALIRGSGWVHDELIRRGVEVVLLDCKGSFHVAFLHSLITLLRAERIDLIHAHLLGSNVYCSLAGFLTATPVIATFHGSVDIRGGEKFSTAKFWSISLGSRFVVAVTERLRHDLLSCTSLWASKLRVIYNGIDTAYFSRKPMADLRASLGVPEGALLIGALGNVRPAKAYQVAVRAIRHLRDDGVDAHFAIAGQGAGPLLDELKQCCLRLGLENRVHLLGYVSDAAGFLASIDLFMLSSVSEGHPLALTQAMAMGLPIIATRCGVEEIIEHQVTGWLVEKDNPRALADAVSYLIQHPDVAHGMGEHARQAARLRYDTSTMRHAYLNIYKTVLRQ